MSAKVNKCFDHKEEIVLRRSEFSSSRTLGICTDSAAVDISRDMVLFLQKGAKGKAELF